MRVANSDLRPLTVRSVVLSGKVLGLTFFTFTTRIDLAVGAAETGEVEFPLDLTDLDGQAVGLIPSRLTVLDEQRNPVMTWHLRRALPKKWVGPTLRAKGTDVAMEELTITCEAIDLE